MEGIPNKLRTLKYYVQHLSMFMRESFGMIDHINSYVMCLQAVFQCFDDFFAKYDIYSDNYFTSENEEVSETYDILNKIGAMFGLNRNMTINWREEPINELPIDGQRNITLNNYDFLIYIKCQITKQNFDGRQMTLQELYDTQLRYSPIDLIYNIAYQNEQIVPMNCYIYFSNFREHSLNLRNLFLDGKLAIESMGIKYIRSCVEANLLLMWTNKDDTPKGYNQFNGGIFDQGGRWA